MTSRTNTTAYVYILECADGSFYTGWTFDVARRVRTHNAGRGSRYTRARLPVKLVYVEPQADRATAMRREATIKKYSRAAKRKLLRNGAARHALEK